MMQPIIRESALHPYVRNVWILENHDIPETPHKLKFFADGCPGLMFQQSESGVRIDEEVLSPFLLYGQTVKPIEMKCTGSYKMIILILHPNALHALFALNASDLTDTCLDMQSYSVHSKAVGSALIASATTEERVRIMEAFLLRQASQAKGDQEIQHMTSFIMNSNGSLPVKHLQARIEMSERTFERKFIRQVGVPPKLFSKIIRFSSSIRQIDIGDYSKLSDIAYENGYADQSHFVRSFKEFTSITPRAYKKKQIEENKQFDGFVQV